MDYEWIVNGYEWICIQLCHCIPLQTLSATQLTKRIIINFKNFQGNETKSQSHQVRRTAAKHIGYVSISYRFRIDLVSIPYRSRFRKRKQYGNDTETIEEAREKQGRMLPTQNIFKLLKLYNYGKTQWYLNQTPGSVRRDNTLCVTQTCWKGNNKIQQRGQFALSISLQSLFS